MKFYPNLHYTISNPPDRFLWPSWTTIKNSWPYQGKSRAKSFLNFQVLLPLILPLQAHLGIPGVDICTRIIYWQQTDSALVAIHRQRVPCLEQTKSHWFLLIPIDSYWFLHHSSILGNPTNGVAAVIRYTCNSRDLGMKNNYTWNILELWIIDGCVCINGFMDRLMDYLRDSRNLLIHLHCSTLFSFLHPLPMTTHWLLHEWRKS